MEPLSHDQLVNLPTAARALDIGRTKAYQLAQTGQFPCRILRVGRKLSRPHRAGLLELLRITYLREQTPVIEQTATTRE
jgi:predicted DNA-binding transcriptional regulator AlpA